MAFKVLDKRRDWEQAQLECVWGTVEKKLDFVVKVRLTETNTVLEFNPALLSEEEFSQLKEGQEGRFYFYIWTTALGKVTLHLKRFEEESGHKPKINNHLILAKAEITDLWEIERLDYTILVGAKIGEASVQKYVFRLDRNKKIDLRPGDICNIAFRVMRSKYHVVSGKTLVNQGCDELKIYGCVNENPVITKEGEARIFLDYVQCLDIIDVGKPNG